MIFFVTQCRIPHKVLDVKTCCKMPAPKSSDVKLYKYLLYKVFPRCIIGDRHSNLPAARNLIYFVEATYIECVL